MRDPLAPPAQAEPFVRILGRDLAITFLMTFGGAEVHLARDPKGKGMVEALVGHAAAAELAKQNRLPRRVPLCKPWLARVARAHGLPPENTPLPVAEIARRMHVDERSVRRWLKGEIAPSPEDRAQLTLPLPPID